MAGEPNGNGRAADDGGRPGLRPTERDEAPLYLARYREREARRGRGTDTPDGAGADDGTPLYLQRFRERRSEASVTEPVAPLWQRAGAEMQRTLTEDNRNKEISAPPEARPRIANDVYLIRHGETQGYSTESGLTPAGSWQAHTWGHTLAKRIRDGETVVFVNAATNRARQTAEQAHKGFVDGLAMFEKDVTIVEPGDSGAFRNFAVATPDGLRDVTGAFRQYYRQLEQFERTATGERPLWLVEVDRFWNTQQGGGDPIQHWLTIPMLHFEPPAMCVRRFWTGIQQLAAEHPGCPPGHLHPLRAHPGLRHRRARVRPGRAVQHRARAGEAGRGGPPGPGDLPQPGAGGGGPRHRRAAGLAARRAVGATGGARRCRHGGALMCRACPTVPHDLLSTSIRRANGSRAMPDRHSSPYVVWFDQYHEDDHQRVGGKCASLGQMTAAGLPVPPGFALTTDAYDTLKTHPDIVELVDEDLAHVDESDSPALRAAARRVRDSIESLPLPDDVREAVEESYGALCELCNLDDVPVAVRSSATAEDLPDASFAGAADTYLWVCGIEDVLDHVRRCWASSFTDRAIIYRRRTGHAQDVYSMAVAIQKMVQPKAAGVAFTLNPSNGDRSQVAIDASWGFGEAVVSGEVTPDNFLVDKVLRQVTTRTIACKTVEYRLNGTGVEKVAIEGERSTQACVTDEEVCAVAQMARRAEKHYGSPQDVEWAIDRHLPDGDNVVLLQSRPETVWSNRKRESGSHASGIDSIVQTLVSPLAAKKG